MAKSVLIKALTTCQGLSKNVKGDQVQTVKTHDPDLKTYQRVVI